MNNEISHILLSHEGKERLFIPRFKAVTISGLSGVGKTDTARTLASFYGIPEREMAQASTQAQPQFVRVGVIMRLHAEKEQRKHVIGPIQRDPQMDTWLDEQQRQLITHADPDNAPLLLEGRLAGVILNDLVTTGQIDQDTVCSFLITAEENIRMQRIIRREQAKQVRDNLPLQLQDEIIDDTIGREQEDLIRWQDQHAILHSMNPYDPRLYNHAIDTSHHRSARDSAQEIHEILMSNGLVIPA